MFTCLYNNTCINMYKWTYITIKIIIYIIHMYYFRRYVTLSRPPPPPVTKCHTMGPTPLPPRALRNSWTAPYHEQNDVEINDSATKTRRFNIKKIRISWPYKCHDFTMTWKLPWFFVTFWNPVITTCWIRPIPTMIFLTKHFRKVI